MAHSSIRKSALEILPDYSRYEKKFGKENLEKFVNHGWLPDLFYHEFEDFFANDYIINKFLPNLILHVYPDIKEGIKAHYKRAIQAFRTENFKEAFMQLIPLIHYIEDIGAPPHAIPIRIVKIHAPMETWINTSLIKIKNYKPKLLGKTEEEILWNLMKKCENLRHFAKEIGEKTAPLVKKNKKEEVEMLNLKAGNKCAEVVVDCLHTIFKLSEKFERKKVIQGKIKFPLIKFQDKKGARVIIINNEKYKSLAKKVGYPDILYESSTEYTTFTDEKGNFEFYNLPEGEYRILSYRVGCKMTISDAFRIKKGGIVNILLELPPTKPLNNLVLNPEIELFYWKNYIPDYWDKNGNIFTSHPVKLPTNTKFRIGIKAKDKKIKVKIVSGENLGELYNSLEIKEDKEIFYFVKNKPIFLRIVIDTKWKPLEETIENVYVVPE